MPLITYKFADGHSEEIEVSDEVAAAFAQLEKYEKKVERKETRRHVSLNLLMENGYDFSADDTDILDVLDKEEQEKSEWREEQFRRRVLGDKKKEIFSLLTFRQADAYFRHKYLHIQKTEIVDMATIRKRQLKNGGNAYTVQVKFKDKGSGKTILETTTWRPDGKMTAKQEERAVQTFAEEFERKIKATVNGATATVDTPNITFREFAAQWLEKIKRDCSLSYYVKARDSISLANEYIGGYKLRELTPAIIQNFYDKLDAMKKKILKVFPKPEFRSVLEEHGLNYMKLRYEVNIVELGE